MTPEVCLCDFHVFFRRILHLFYCRGHKWKVITNQEGKHAVFCQVCLKWVTL